MQLLLTCFPCVHSSSILIKDYYTKLACVTTYHIDYNKSKKCYILLNRICGLCPLAKLLFFGDLHYPPDTQLLTEFCYTITPHNL